MEEDVACKPVSPSPWANRIPEEILLKIFKLVTKECGSVPFLCRVAQVCRYWKELAYHWELWQHVDLSSGWIHKSLSGLTLLSESRFGDDTVSLILEAWFNLTDQDLVCLRLLWTNSSSRDFAVISDKTVSSCCPSLRELDLSSCHQLSYNALHVIADHFPCLKSIRLANMAPVTLGHRTFSYFLQKKGPQLEKLILSNADVNKNFQKNMQHVAMYCPKLLHLEITHLNFLDGEKLTIYVANLQFGCPNLEVLDLSGTHVRFYNPREDEIKCPGFHKLKEYHAPIDGAEADVSVGSTLLLSQSFNLKKLILERNQHNLDLIPATDVEYLKVSESITSSEILNKVRWRSSLKVLDLSWTRNLSRTKMDNGIKACFSKSKPAFKQLTDVYLCGTLVSWHGLCFLLEHCKTLKLLNCTLCRNVSRFWARELSGDLLRLLYRLVTEELSSDELTKIQQELQSDPSLTSQQDLSMSIKRDVLEKI